MTTRAKTLESLIETQTTNVAHIAWITPGGRVAICGAGPTVHCNHRWKHKHRECSCGAAVCPGCKSILDVFNATGCYEGELP